MARAQGAMAGNSKKIPMTPEVFVKHYRKEIDHQIALTVPSMHGWCTVEKALAMADLIYETRPQLVIELGVFGGRSLIPQAMALKTNGHGHIYGIDPWKKEACLEGANDKENDEWWEKLDLEAVFLSCMDFIWSSGLDPWCSVIRAKSEHVVGLLPIKEKVGIEDVATNPIDILHIDGNHSEVASTRDVELWLPRVRRGGHIWLDDTDWATTKKAVDLLTAACDVVKDVGTCRLFRKR
jgi:predicted O-methyltransferase YrrM